MEQKDFAVARNVVLVTCADLRYLYPRVVLAVLVAERMVVAEGHGRFLIIRITNANAAQNIPTMPAFLLSLENHTLEITKRAQKVMSNDVAGFISFSPIYPP